MKLGFVKLILKRFLSWLDRDHQMRPNNEEFDKFINDLQEEIYKEELKFFSKKVVEEFHHLKNWGKMEDAEAKAIIKGTCGITQMIFLRIEKDIIIKASFFTDECGPTVACGSKLTTMITNKSTKEAEKITPEDLEDALDGLLDEHKHCSLLAVNILQKVLNEIKKGKKTIIENPIIFLYYKLLIVFFFLCIFPTI